MKTTIGKSLIFMFLFCSLSSIASASGKGEGGIVLEDTPIYARLEVLDAMTNLRKGQPVVAIRNEGLSILLGKSQYIFDEKSGRVQVFYFPGDDPTRGKFYSGWIDATKVKKFFYDCSCGGKDGNCSPFVTRGFRLSFMWNSCFTEAWEKKLSEMDEESAKTQIPPAAEESIEERLRKLNELLMKNLITQEEYDRKRTEILNSF